jgi:mono/diheme cytochrome c family protein
MLFDLSNRFLVLLCLLALGVGQSGCSSPSEPIPDEAMAAGKAKEDFAADAVDYFPQMDRMAPPGVGIGQLQPLSLTTAEIQGRNTWMLWTGGNEAFWDWLAQHGYGFVDLLKLVDFNPLREWPRFEKAGLIVDPDMHGPRTADRYGLYIREPMDDAAPKPDESTFGRSSGIVGLRLYDNPNFDANAAKRWDVKRYYDDPSYYLDPSLVRPYRVGMSCGFCHVGPHPLDPPANVERPNWSNLSATIGNQYLRTRSVFGNLLKPDSYFYHLLDSQLPGTLDTSLISSDNINNANAQNAIFELAGRFDRSGLFSHRSSEDYRQDYLNRYGTNPMERAGEAAAGLPVLFYGLDSYAKSRSAPRVLIDGADSIGPWAALARVYLNIGTYHQRWVTLHNPLFGYTRAKPFTLADAEKGSVYWKATEALMDDLAKYLVKASSPMRLKDARDNTAYVKGQGVPWAKELDAGQRVFASRCIVCHSSRQPKMFDERPAAEVLTLLSDGDYQAWAEREVKTEEFWRENYLSTDRRLPVSLVKTNAARSLASNGLAGHMWQDFSSEDYKALPSVGKVQIWNPFTRKTEDFTMPGGGRGYYRPASLVSMWATAPFLHNNSVGLFNNDPSVEGRVSAFKDAINKLLVRAPTEEGAAIARWRLGSDLNEMTPDRRENDHGVIWRLPQATWVRIPASQLPHLVASTTGLSPAFIERPWIIPSAIFLVATLCIIARRKILRYLGYLVTVIAFGTAGVTYFAAGRLVDAFVGPIPAGLPVNVVANLDIDRLMDEGSLNAAKRIWRVGKLIVSISGLPQNSPPAKQKVSELGTALDAVSRNSDHVLDRGHYFGAPLTEKELQDLIELLLTL